MSEGSIFERRPRGNENVYYEGIKCAILNIGYKGEWFQVVFDRKNLKKVKRHKWFISQRSKRRDGSRMMYAVATVNTKNKALFMHKLLAPHGEKVKHKDDNGLNNMESNLGVFEGAPLGWTSRNPPEMLNISRHRGNSWTVRIRRKGALLQRDFRSLESAQKWRDRMQDINAYWKEYASKNK